jgi:hypothetical protein
MYLADTPPGRYVIDRQIDGWRTSHLGRLFRPSTSSAESRCTAPRRCPRHPASHGRVRLSIAATDFVWGADLAPVGSAVWVHGTSPVPT